MIIRKQNVNTKQNFPLTNNCLKQRIFKQKEQSVNKMDI